MIKEFFGHYFGFTEEIVRLREIVKKFTEDIKYWQKKAEKANDNYYALKSEFELFQKPVDIPSAEITYSRPLLVSERTYEMIGIDIRNFIMADFHMEKKLKAKNLIYDGTQDLEELIPKIYRLAKKGYKYGKDEKYGFEEYWMFPFELQAVLKYGKAGDCVANYEEIYTPNGLKKIGELKEGDLVLSYDFDKEKFCEKPIEKIWEKGKLKCKRVYFRNGTTIDVTKNHPLWLRTNQYGKSKYEKTILSEVNQSLWYRRKVPVAKKIPYKIKDIEWLNPNLCFVTGHFIAEGWVEKNEARVCTSGYDCEIIAGILEENNIPFSEKTNGNGVPIITFLKSDFKGFLGKFKTSSFNINIPEEIFHLPENKIRKFLEGYKLGDGYIDKRTYSFKHNNEFVYNTISDQLKDDLVRLHLQLGEPLYTYYCKNHMGLGNKPIWRIYYNPESFFARDYGYKGLSETSIVKVEDIGEMKTRDFHVKDTSTFFFKNGLCAHQCDDWANLIGSYFVAAKIPRNRWLISVGVTRAGYGHATVYVKDEMQVWRHLNSTRPESKETRLSGFPSNKDEKDMAGIKPNGFWFSYNDKFSVHRWDSEEAREAFKLAEQPIYIKVIK